MMDFLTDLDRSLFLLINKNLANPVFDLFFPYITEKRTWYIPLIAVVAVVLIRTKDRKRAATIMGLALLTLAISNPLCDKVLKPLFNRLRPCDLSYFQDGKHIFLIGSRLLIDREPSMSLPSAHAMNSFAQAVHLALWFPKKKAWFLGIAFLVAFSRVYVGVHYPFDVLLGAVLGVLLGAAVFYGYRWFKPCISGGTQCKRSANTQDSPVL